MKDQNTILAVKGGTGALSLVAVIVSLVLFRMFRRYKKDHLTEIGITERLVLYSAVAAIVRSVVVILQSSEVNYDKSHQTQQGYTANASKAQQGWCKAMGFFDQLSNWGVLLTTEMIMVHLFIQLTLGVDVSKKKIVEVFYIVFPVLFPLSFSWVPFILDQDGYGMSGAWCWICSPTYQIILLFVPFAFCQIINLTFLLILYPKLFFEKINKDDRSDLIKQHAPLLLSLLLAVVINIMALVNRLVIINGSSDEKLSDRVWIVHAIVESCWGFVSAIVIMLYLLALCRLQPNERDYDLKRDADVQSSVTVRNSIQLQFNYSSCIESSDEL